MNEAGERPAKSVNVVSVITVINIDFPCYDGTL